MRETILKPLLLPGLCILVLAGCLDDDEGNGNNAQTGTLTSVGVANLNYETRSRSGTTDDEGRFEYLPGETISFSVGNLQIASDVPVAPFLTSMDFTEEQREKLRKGGTNEEGLQTHRVVEEDLARNNRIAINTMRLLMVLGQDFEQSPDDTIRITDRTIEQLNSYLAENDIEIDFSQPTNQFASPSIPSYDDAGNLEGGSVVNQMLDSICFEPEGDELCEAPPTETEINNTTDPEEKSDLQRERQEITDSRRLLSEISVNEVSDFLLSETRDFRLDLESAYFLEPDAITLEPSETGIQEIQIKRVGSKGVNLQGNGLDARAEGSALQVSSVDWQDAVVEYFHDGSEGEQGTVLINFKIETPDFDNYRWFRKTLRVCINADDQPCST